MSKSTPDGASAVMTLIIKAAQETIKAIGECDPDGERREALLAHLQDQVFSLVRPSGYMADDIITFLHGKNPEVAKAIAKRCGAEVVNALGYENISL